MNFFKTGLQSVLGTSEVNETASGAETVSLRVCFDFVQNFIGIFDSGRETGRPGAVVNDAGRPTRCVSCAQVAVKEIPR